ncbi:hypothetical protein ADN00_09545 [Ornatilinea apprima]|uniref:DUF7916 domain-containing protein n=1 Tax=Ornatilinea apprima TaxID=1134406 RepID=A0A0P6XV63_9CHLR|nr:hypothetical protein [Ornatilinea apprima]KPL77350.1 hypothetical protein ADN00_09545 [Ornatilinea apprima]
MAKRIIEVSPSILAKLEGRELIDAIRVSGGRAVSAEIVAFRPGLVDGTNNGNLAATFGADIVHMNHYDVDRPQVAGFSSTPEGVEEWAKQGISLKPSDQIEDPTAAFFASMGFGITIRDLRNAIGRVVGLSLEVNFPGATAPRGRLSIPDTAERALEQGAAYLTLIGTPAHSPKILADNIRELRTALGPDPMLVAGRMPWGGSRPGMPDFMKADEVELQVEAGADMVAIAAPGTMPGATIEAVRAAVDKAHQLGALAEVSIGTSQESADEETVRRLAMDSRLTGADLYQIGDGGYSGVTLPENILSFAMAIKGRRHAYRRMAMIG